MRRIVVELTVYLAVWSRSRSYVPNAKIPFQGINSNLFHFFTDVHSLIVKVPKFRKLTFR
jgi:hypothetical protein